MAGSSERVLIFDPLSQYANEGYTIRCTQPSQLVEFLGKHRHKPYRILYQPLNSTPLKHWEQVGTVAYAAGDMTLCIDELGLLCKYGEFAVVTTGKDPILQNIVHFGRHRNITVIATAQRPTDVAVRYRALCTDIRIFQTSEGKDVKYICEKIGESNGPLLPKLPKYAFVHWTDDYVEIYQPKGVK